MIDNKPIVHVTKHYMQRYRERVGTAPPTAQSVWIGNSLKKQTLHWIKGNQYRVKLNGAPFLVALAKEGKNVWVAITVFPLRRKGA